MKRYWVLLVLLAVLLISCGKQEGDEIIVGSTEPAEVAPPRLPTREVVGETPVIQPPKPEVREKQMTIKYLNMELATATFIRTPNDKTILVDCGTNLMSDWLIYFLRRRENVTALDMLVVTNPNVDRLGGCLPVIRTIPTKLVVDNGQFISNYASQTFADTLKQINGTERVTLVNDTQIAIDPAITLDLFVPYERSFLSRIEDNSIVTKVTFGEFSTVLMSDCGELCQRDIFTENLKAKILEVPEHGSDRGTNLKLLNATLPEVVVVSVGENDEQMPVPWLRKELYARNIQPYRTDFHGTISVVTNGKTYRVTPEVENKFY